VAYWYAVTRLGRAAYVWTGARNLNASRVRAVIDVDGKNWEQLSFGADVQHDARYSPDGTMILFCRAPAPEGPWQICLKRLDGDEDEFVQMTKDGSNLLPDWRGDE
jgi:Tol biopolymer transport system component